MMKKRMLSYCGLFLMTLFLAALAPITASADGSGALVATLAVLNNTKLLDVPFGGTVSPYYWVVNRNIMSLDFSAAIDVAPGTGNTLQFTIKYATISPTENCADIPSAN